jgi:hypothetical protein
MNQPEALKKSLAIIQKQLETIQGTIIAGLVLSLILIIFAHIIA